MAPYAAHSSHQGGQASSVASPRVASVCSRTSTSWPRVAAAASRCSVSAAISCCSFASWRCDRPSDSCVETRSQLVRLDFLSNRADRHTFRPLFDLVSPASVGSTRSCSVAHLFVDCLRSFSCLTSTTAASVCGVRLAHTK